MKNENIKIEYRNIEDLIPYINNARNNAPAVDQVASSIKNFGMVNPILIDPDDEIIAGHTRLLALKKLNYRKVPTIKLNDLTEAEVKALRLADNKTAELAEWDLELLTVELEALKNEDIDFEMSEFGFDLDLGDDFAIIEEDEWGEEDEEEIEPTAKTGQVWKLGNHRLMCGDSTKKEDVKKLMDGQLADLVITDPPYNVAIGIEDIEDAKARNRRIDGKKIQNDEMSDDKFYSFLLSAFENLRDNLKKGGAFYIWYASREAINFNLTLKDAGLEVRQQLIWNKNTMVLGRQDYQWKHEPCLYGWKDGAAHYFKDSRREYTVIEDAITDFKQLKKDELVELLENIYQDKISTTVINEKKPAASKLHPTMKPVNLIAYQMKNSSQRGEKVLDLFGGSGTTLIAAEQLARKSYIMEFDPHYVDVIIARWEKLTGNKAELIDA